MRNILGLMLGVTAVLLVQSCGSEDTKKKAYKAPPTGQGGSSMAGSKGGGDAGETSSGGTAGSSAGSKGDGGAAGDDGTGGNGGAAGDMGSGGGAGAAGEVGSGGGAGAAGESAGGAGGDSGDNCPPGFDDCDGNPDTACEDLSAVTTCGACNITCSSTNGTVACQNFTCTVTSCTTGFDDCDGTGENGCETSLVSNAAHCGQCGRNCGALGSTCATNICNEIPLQQDLGFGTQGRNGLTWLFTSAGIFHATTDNYQIVRYLLDGTTTQLIWAAPGQTAGTASLVLIGTELHWSQHGIDADDYTAPMFRKDISAMPGDTPLGAWSPEWAPQFVTVQGNTLYWMSGDYQSGDPGGYVYARSVSAPDTSPGAKIVTLDQGFHGAVTAFEATSDALYWVTSSAANGVAREIRTTPLSGGIPTAVPPVPGVATTPVYAGTGVSDLHGVGDTLYFSRNVDAELQNGIYRFKAGDAAPTQLVVVDGVRSLLVDGNYIYYTYTTVGVWRAPIEGGVAGVRISDVTGASFILGSDANYLYVAQTSGTNTNLFKVVK